jgi:aminocarboxymuconate-semialdehyde decarboxylase
MDDTEAPPLRLVDFHNHFIGTSCPLTNLARVPAPQRGRWQEINGLLTSPDALVASLDESGITARVISAPPEFVEDADGHLRRGLCERINDAVAELVAKHPGRLHGLATVDCYGGEAGARELERAVNDLGLRGVFMPSASGDLLPSSPAARPTLATAAALGVPVFLHPIEDPALFGRFKSFGRLGVRLTRGTINSAALFAIVESGLFEDYPNLRIVVTALALSGILLAGTIGDGARLRGDTPMSMRRHVYADTTGVHPTILRCAIDLLGADHVLMGTDWPVVIEDAVPSRLQAAFAACGLDADAQRMVAGGNALGLLAVN